MTFNGLLLDLSANPISSKNTKVIIFFSRFLAWAFAALSNKFIIPLEVLVSEP